MVLENLRDRFNFKDHPGIVPLHKANETEKAAFMVRQFFAHNL